MIHGHPDGYDMNCGTCQQEGPRMYPVQRQCMCGKVWTGQSMFPLKEGETKPRPGCCQECGAEADRRLAELQKQRLRAIDEQLTLDRPRRTQENSDG